MGTPEAGQSAAAPSPANSASPARRFVLALGTELAFGGEVQEQRGSDLVNASGYVLFGLNASARYRVARPVALGVRGSWAMDLGDRGYASSSAAKGSYDRSLGQLTVEGRYQPGDRRGWYAAIRAGVAIIVDSEGSYAAIQGGPLGTVALGYDVSIVSALSLGLELQGNLAGFPENGVGYTAGEDGRSSTFVYGTSSWLGFGLVCSLGI
ncbi:MAG: hypothetical protein ABI895_35205 [Deltaproteobacteria bacterium]